MSCCIQLIQREVNINILNQGEKILPDFFYFSHKIGQSLINIVYEIHFVRGVGMIANNSSNMIPESIKSSLYGNIKEIISSIPSKDSKDIEEIRLKVQRPLMIQNNTGDFFVSRSGLLGQDKKNAYIVDKDEIKKTIEIMCDSSVYAVQDEIKNGYIIIRGGHRVGIAGKVVIRNKDIYHIKDISSLNIRIARQIIGAADKLTEHIYKDKKIYNTLIISPPQCGKTTMLRDIARQFSNGIKRLNIRGYKVGIVDERSEIAACCQGIPQHDVGFRTDVLDGCPKAQGIYMMIRSMSPEIIITDEIGGGEDIYALTRALNAGIKIITSVHGYGRQDILNKPSLRNLIIGNFFEKIVVLSRNEGAGTIEEVWERS